MTLTGVSGANYATGKTLKNMIGLPPGSCIRVGNRYSSSSSQYYAISATGKKIYPLAANKIPEKYQMDIIKGGGTNAHVYLASIERAPEKTHHGINTGGIDSLSLSFYRRFFPSLFGSSHIWLSPIEIFKFDRANPSKGFAIVGLESVGLNKLVSALRETGARPTDSFIASITNAPTNEKRDLAREALTNFPAGI